MSILRNGISEQSDMRKAFKYTANRHRLFLLHDLRVHINTCKLCNGPIEVGDWVRIAHKQYLHHGCFVDPEFAGFIRRTNDRTKSQS